jgi:DNA-binding NarL/FixJ family response regulator
MLPQDDRGAAELREPFMPNDKIRVVIVDDHPGVRVGIRNLLLRANDIIVVGEGEDGMKAIELARASKPDIVLLDVELPILGGDIVARRLHETQPETKVLAVSTYSDPTYIQSMLANGASGYITKEEAPDMLLEAIYSVYQNEKLWISPKALANVRPNSPDEQMLTDRELGILKQLVLNRSEREIAESMHIEEHQVSNHVKLLMQKFDAESLDGLKTAAKHIVPNQDLTDRPSAT